MKYKKSVYRNFALITQFGISMLVPIALCVFAGIMIDRYFDTYFVILFIFLGMAAGGRNVYRMAMSTMKEDERDGKDNKENDKENDKDRKQE